jgi:hypothetical protein
MARKKTLRPSFMSPIYAWFRQGSKEISQVLPATPQSIRPVEEPGTLGNPTMQTLTAEMGTVEGYNRRLDMLAKRDSRNYEQGRQSRER